MPSTSAHPPPSAADPLSRINGEGRSKTSLPQSLRLSDEALEELTQLLELIQLVKRGNFTARFQGSGHNLVNKIGRTLNEIVEINETLADELVRISQIVGQEERMTVICPPLGLRRPPAPPPRCRGSNPPKWRST